MSLTTREGVAQGVDLIARHYPNFAPTNPGQLRGLHDDYVEALGFTDGDTIVAGFRFALHEATQFAPRFSAIVQAVGRAKKLRDGGPIAAPEGNPDAVCVSCGTERLGYFVDRLDPESIERLYPIHKEHCCVFISARMIHVSQRVAA